LGRNSAFLRCDRRSRQGIRPEFGDLDPRQRQRFAWSAGPADRPGDRRLTILQDNTCGQSGVEEGRNRRYRVFLDVITKGDGLTALNHATVPNNAVAEWGAPVQNGPCRRGPKPSQTARLRPHGGNVRWKSRPRRRGIFFPRPWDSFQSWIAGCLQPHQCDLGAVCSVSEGFRIWSRRANQGPDGPGCFVSVPDPIRFLRNRFASHPPNLNSLVGRGPMKARSTTPFG